MYIDGLHTALREAGLGVRIYGRLVPILMYADDVVLLARNMAEMERMHGVVEEYAQVAVRCESWQNQDGGDRIGGH